MACLFAAWVVLPTVAVVVLGFLWTWRLAYDRPSRRLLVGLTVGAVVIGVLYPLPIALASYLKWKRTFLPFELEVPAGYVGSALLVACEETGDEVRGRVVFPADGVARIRHDPDDLVGRYQIEARDARGELRTVVAYQSELADGCGWLEYAVLPAPTDPVQDVPWSAEGLRSREARVAGGRTFADVSRDAPPPVDTDPPPTSP